MAACKVIEVSAHEVDAALEELSAALPSSNHEVHVVWVRFHARESAYHILNRIPPLTPSQYLINGGLMYPDPFWRE